MAAVLTRLPRRCTEKCANQHVFERVIHRRTHKDEWTLYYSFVLPRNPTQLTPPNYHMGTFAKRKHVALVAMAVLYGRDL